jgi:hypothetical protein
MLLRIILLMGFLISAQTIEAQPYTERPYAVSMFSKGEIRDIIRDRENLRVKVKELAAKNVRLETYLGSLKGQISDLRAAERQDADNRLALTRLNAKYLSLITVLKGNVATLQQLLEAAEKRADKLEGVIENLRDQVKQQQEALNDLQEKVEHFKQMATDLEIVLLYREAELDFVEESFHAASLDVFRVQGKKTISVYRNNYARGLRRKDKIEIHLWTYTFDEEYEKASSGKGKLWLYTPDGRRELRVTFFPAKNVNKKVDKRAYGNVGISSGYGMLYRMQKKIDLRDYLDKSDMDKGRATKVPYEVILPNGDRFYGVLTVKR